MNRPYWAHVKPRRGAARHYRAVLDYGRRLEFGISIIPEAATVAQARALVVAADAAGVDLVGVQDHPYQRRFVDTLALIGNLLSVTERIRIFPDVANLPLRPPAMLAKQAATLDLLSGGRFELGLGAGGFWEAITAMGGPRRSPGESVEALAEAIHIIRQAWSDSAAVRFGGRYYQASGYRPGPAPAHAIGIWIGAYRPRMLRLTGRLADGWIPSLGGNLTLEQLGGLHAVIDGAARAAGRDPATIRRLLNFGGQIGMTPAGEGGLGSLGGDALSGSVDEWVERLAGWATEHGIDTFILWPQLLEPAQIGLWGSEIAPRVQAEVDQRRAARSKP